MISLYLLFFLLQVSTSSSEILETIRAFHTAQLPPLLFSNLDFNFDVICSSLWESIKLKLLDNAVLAYFVDSFYFNIKFLLSDNAISSRIESFNSALLLQH